MPRLKQLTAVLCASSLALTAGCATRSSNIAPTYVSDVQYGSLDCDGIRAEMARVSAEVTKITGQQDSAATTDAVVMGVGLVLFWPALFFLAATEDQKEQLGQLKGQAEALNRAALAKGCTASQPAAIEAQPTGTAPATVAAVPAS